MKKLIILGLVGVFLAAGGAVGLTAWPIGETRTLDDMAGDANRGAYLARMSGCIACHTDFKNGGAPLAGGVALKTDFGTFFSPNLTTDRDHGLGQWTISDFARAVRQGVSPAGEPYYPAFPYPFYARLSDQDIADLWAAFQTVPAVAEPSREQDLIFPFSFRPGLKLWREAFVDFSPFPEMPGKSALWKRGRYIVEGPAHCAACHTPRNLAGARQAEFHLHGADSLPTGGKTPPITPNALAKNGWDKTALKYALRTSVKPDGDAFGGAMGEVVRDGTSFLSDQDLEAIATYLLEGE